MTVFLWDHKLTYVSAPKVACTSLKHFFFEIENGFRFTPYRANGRPRHIHDVAYRGLTFETIPHGKIADHVRLTVVRDPVRRLLSAYSNRVLHHRELGPARVSPAFRSRGATPNPSLEAFVDNLELYLEASPSIRRHTLPLVEILGRDPAYYDAVHSIEDLDAFRRRVEGIVGVVPEIRKLQTGGPKIAPEDLGPAARRKIEEFYAEDYAVFGRHF